MNNGGSSTSSTSCSTGSINVDVNSSTGSVAKTAAEPGDIYRDTWVRYLGYANEVGEAFRPLYPRFLRPSYALAFGYVFMDTFDKGSKERSREGSSQSSVIRLGSDTLLWQTLASVIIPGYTIKYITKLGEIALQNAKSGPPVLKRFGPTFLGLAAIPLIIHPIDNFVDYLMDNTFRKI